MLENIDAELAMSKIVIERIRNDKENEKFYKSAGIMRTKEMDSILYFREKESNLVQDILDAQMEMNRMRHDGEDYSALEEQQEALKKELKTVQDSAKLIRERTGMDIVGDEVVKTEPKSKGDRFKGLFTAIPPYLKTAIMSIGPIGAIIKGMSLITNKGNARLFRDNAMKTGMFLGKFLLYVSLLGFIIFLIHKSGIIQYIIETLTLFDEAYRGATTWFGGFWETFKLIFTGLYDFLIGLFKFFYGAFTGDTDKFMKGLSMMFSGIVDTLTGFFGTLVLTAITVLVATIGSAGRALVNALMERAEGGVGGILSGIGGVMAASRFYKGAMAGSRLGPKGALVGALVTGFGVDKAISYGYDALMGNNASGGLIQRTGSYLVGEAGPEIVSLPAGTQVTPNNQMRGGGQVVNVYVNGRLGASDRELNEIGRKVGMKINREINKSNNIGVTLGSKAGSAVGRMI